MNWSKPFVPFSGRNDVGCLHRRFNGTALKGRNKNGNERVSPTSRKEEETMTAQKDKNKEQSTINQSLARRQRSCRGGTRQPWGAKRRRTLASSRPASQRAARIETARLSRATDATPPHPEVPRRPRPHPVRHRLPPRDADLVAAGLGISGHRERRGCSDVAARQVAPRKGAALRTTRTAHATV